MKDYFGNHNTRRSDVDIEHYRYLLSLKAELRDIKSTHISVTGAPDMITYYLNKAIEYTQANMDDIVKRSMGD